mmetsp:Transcript_133205/g.230998  ORF Transcript_133205/g.230998 Transcript_133205/m.230998 type:complete len:108 (+) Transcript_133205:201-524(+)
MALPLAKVKGPEKERAKVRDTRLDSTDTAKQDGKRAGNKEAKVAVTVGRTIGPKTSGSRQAGKEAREVEGTMLTQTWTLTVRPVSYWLPLRILHFPDTMSWPVISLA